MANNGLSRGDRERLVNCFKTNDQALEAARPKHLRKFNLRLELRNGESILHIPLETRSSLAFHGFAGIPPTIAVSLTADKPVSTAFSTFIGMVPDIKPDVFERQRRRIREEKSGRHRAPMATKPRQAEATI